MSNRFPAAEVGIEDLLSRNTHPVYFIPNFQRRYAWTREQALQLWNDIRVAWELKNGSQHFIGSMIFVSAQSGSGANYDALAEKEQIVDGQQRLITLYVLLAVIEYEFRGNHDSLTRVESVFTTDIAERLTYHDMNGGLHSRIEFFLKDVQSVISSSFASSLEHRSRFQELESFDRSTSSHHESLQRMRSNFRDLHSAVKAFTFIQQGEDTQKLASLYRFLLTNVRCVKICTPSLTSAFRVFNCLNSRGMPLEKYDILKSDFLHHLDRDDQNQYAVRWDEVMSDIGEKRFGELFEVLHAVVHEQHEFAPTKDAAYKFLGERHRSQEEVRKFFDNAFFPAAEIVVFMLKLLDNWEDPVNTTKSYADTCQRLRWLMRMEEFEWDWMAVVIVAHIKYFTKKKSKFTKDSSQLDSFREVVFRLERHVLMIHFPLHDRKDPPKSYRKKIRYDAGDRRRKYTKMMNQLDHLADVAADRSAINPGRQEKLNFMKWIMGHNIGNNSCVKSRLVVLLLLRLEEYETELVHPLITSSKVGISLEHVYPREPKQTEWPAWKRHRNIHTHRLGNIIPLALRQNTKCGNKAFQKKKNIYKNNSLMKFPSTEYFLKVGDWTPDTFKIRNYELICRVANIYGLHHFLVDQKFGVRSVFKEGAELSRKAGCSSQSKWNVQSFHDSDGDGMDSDNENDHELNYESDQSADDDFMDDGGRSDEENMTDDPFSESTQRVVDDLKIQSPPERKRKRQ
eukprot:ANDGO_00757.mRNA.1 DUF262 domain-containing protein